MAINFKMNLNFRVRKSETHILIMTARQKRHNRHAARVEICSEDLLERDWRPAKKSWRRLIKNDSIGHFTQGEVHFCMLACFHRHRSERKWRKWNFNTDSNAPSHCGPYQAMVSNCALYIAEMLTVVRPRFLFFVVKSFFFYFGRKQFLTKNWVITYGRIKYFYSKPSKMTKKLFTHDCSSYFWHFNTV